MTACPRLAPILLLTATLVACLGGCDGSSSDPDDPPHREIEGALESSDTRHPDDGSFYDAYAFRAVRGQRVTLTMRSAEVDSYLHLFDEQGREITQNDDMATGQDDARIVFQAMADGVYTVWATSYEADDTGPYSLTIDKAEPPPTR